MPISRKDIINELKRERHEAQKTIVRCNLALAAFEGVAEADIPVADPGPDMGGHRNVDTTEKSQAPRISLDNLNRAKARVKRFDKPFTRGQLAGEMKVALSTASEAIKALTAEGWIELAEDRPNSKGGKLFRYLPAGKDPTHKPRGVVAGGFGGGRGEAIAGTGKGLRSTDHDINAIIRKLRADDWLVTKTGSDHYRATKGIKQVRFSGSPPGQQAINAIKSNLRNAGARL